jgi:aspartyl-tRNA synthetase
MEFFTGLKRSHRCGELSINDLNQEVVLAGWVQRKRNLGGLVFIDLRDRSGIIQIVFNDEVSKELFDKAQSIKSEYVIAVIGKVKKREEQAINTKMKTGEIEVIASELRILSQSEALPFNIEENSPVNEAVRLKYRYLDLRRPDMQKIMILRHKALQLTRKFFTNEGFLEIETPILGKSTPEGARVYLVPSRIHEGKFYALPQSPQLFKQLLMVGGMDRYFQVARCFRDEDLRADRQPEFTQVDVEMSFVNMDDIFDVVERYLSGLFNEMIGTNVKAPFSRMTYKYAMENYGSDKPDTRFEMKLIDLTNVLGKSEFKVFSDAIEKGGSIRAINAKGLGSKLSRKEIDSLGEIAQLLLMY